MKVWFSVFTWLSCGKCPALAELLVLACVWSGVMVFASFVRIMVFQTLVEFLKGVGFSLGFRP